MPSLPPVLRKKKRAKREQNWVACCPRQNVIFPSRRQRKINTNSRHTTFVCLVAFKCMPTFFVHTVLSMVPSRLHLSLMFFFLAFKFRLLFFSLMCRGSSDILSLFSTSPLEPCLSLIERSCPRPCYKIMTGIFNTSLVICPWWKNQSISIERAEIGSCDQDGFVVIHAMKHPSIQYLNCFVPSCCCRAYLSSQWIYCGQIRRLACTIHSRTPNLEPPIGTSMHVFGLWAVSILENI